MSPLLFMALCEDRDAVQSEGWQGEMSKFIHSPCSAHLYADIYSQRHKASTPPIQSDTWHQVSLERKRNIQQMRGGGVGAAHHCGGGWRDEDLRREPGSTHSRSSHLSTLSFSSVPSQLPIQIKECVASSAHCLPIPTENRQEGSLRKCQSWPPREAAGLTSGTFFGNHSGSVREPTVN